MFGRIISIDNDILYVENLKKIAETNVLNYHVAFDETNRVIIGEILAIDEKAIKIITVGEIKDGKFITGVIKKPNFSSIARIIYKSELELILGSQDINNKNYVYFGKSMIYDNYNISVEMNNFMSNHFAVIGNTGSGKSCGLARLLQNIFYHNNESMPVNAHIVLFDVYGEYNNALSKINEIPNINFKSFTTDIHSMKGDLVNIPTNFLEVDDLALLLNVTDESLLPILEKTLKLVYIFTSDNKQVYKFKNDIIANAILDILASGKNPTQIRDQIVAVLSQYNTETFNLDTVVPQPGYNRTIRQCLNIDNQGKINAMGFIIDFLDQYVKVDLNQIEIEKMSTYSLEDLYYALNFALISEGVFSNDLIFEKVTTMKVRLNAIINSDNKSFFTHDKYISKNDFVEKFFKKGDESVQIINMNFNYIDDRFAKVLTKVFAKLFFNYATGLEKRASFPIHMILEEAHRYVQNDTDINVIGYNIFDRITKEGRKYGVILGFITQRPSELSKTSLSQCSNFIVFRMFHPEDINIVSSISFNITPEIIEKIKSLKPGKAMCFGSAFNVPVIVSFELPDPMPESTNADIVDSWYEQ